MGGIGGQNGGSMGAHIVGRVWGTTTQRITNFQAFIAGLGTELFPFKNGCMLRWYFNCIYFGGGQLAFKTIFFHCLKTLVFMVKRYSILFFCSSNCLVLLSTHFFIQFTQSAMFEKKLNIPAPYISDQFYYYRSDLPTLLSTFSKISQNFRHFPVFYMHTNHM